MLVQLHPIELIVNVQWEEGDGIFVFGDQKFGSDLGDLYRGEVESTTEAGAEVPPDTSSEDADWSIVRSTVTNYGGRSYALVNTDDPESGTPTFVMGSWEDSSMSIITSHDAKTWTVTFNDTNFFGGFGVQGIVWDSQEKAFYATAWTNRSPGNSAETFRGYLLRSTDGMSWSRDQEFITSIDSGNSVEAQKKLADALKRHCVKTENAGGIPDGIRGYDPDKEI